MKRLLCHLACLAAISSGFALALRAAGGDLDWPEVTQTSKPWSRWWWLASIGTKEEFSAEMERYAAAGLGGLEITPIYGVRGEEKRFRSFLSPAWLDPLEHVLDEAARLNLGIDMATGNGWPFGGPWVTPENACRTFVPKTFMLKGGERLAEPVAAVQEPLVRVAGPRRVAITELKDPVAANSGLQDLALDQVRFPRRLPLLALMAYSDRGDVLDLTARVDAGGRLDWTAPPGSWTLYALFLGWHGKQVERAGPGGEGDVIDHFSVAALRQHLAHFDRAFSCRSVNRLRAYFNDSYEVDDARGESNWTPRFFEEFRKRRGYDLREQLHALMGDAGDDANSRVISDHRETISDLLLEEFTLPWSRCAESRGALTRNQAHGSPANILDLYAASGIPETEGDSIVEMKLASSATHLAGKRLASSETATWLGELDLTFLAGINHNCYHGTAFSPPGEPWPGFHFYASVEFDPSNSFWADFPLLNAYVARVQSFLQAGRPANDILLYYPIHDTWAIRGNGSMPHFGTGGARGGRPAHDTAQALLAGGYAFDFVSDRLLASVHCEGGRLTAGGNSWLVVLVPETKYMPLETLRRLLDLAGQGATVLFHKRLPEDVPGLGNLEARRSEFRALLRSFEDGGSTTGGPAVRARNRGRVAVGEDLRGLLELAGVRREALVDRGLAYQRRSIERGWLYFLLNPGEVEFAGWVPLAAPARAAAVFDPMSGARGVAALRKVAGSTEIYLQLAPREALLVRTFDRLVAGPNWRWWRRNGAAQPISGRWEVRFLSGGPTLPAAADVSELRSWTEFGGEAGKAFAGTAAYKLIFPRPAGNAPAWRLDLGRVADSARVRLNGREIAGLIQAPFRVIVPRDRLRARNTLEVLVTNLAANRIADLDRRDPSWKRFYNINYPARFAENRGPDGNFTAAKWAPRPSGLLGPVTLAPLSPLERP